MPCLSEEKDDRFALVSGGEPSTVRTSTLNGLLPTSPVAIASGVVPQLYISGNSLVQVIN